LSGSPQQPARRRMSSPTCLHNHGSIAEAASPLNLSMEPDAAEDASAAVEMEFVKSRSRDSLTFPESLDAEFVPTTQSAASEDFVAAKLQSNDGSPRPRAVSWSDQISTTINTEVPDSKDAEGSMDNSTCSREGTAQCRLSADESFGALIVGSKVIRGVTFYTVQVSHGMKTWTLDKRYSDFVRLDRALAANGSNLSRQSLPQKGWFGLRKVFNSGFNVTAARSQRLEGLSHYLENLIRQANVTKPAPGHLTAFLRYSK